MAKSSKYWDNRKLKRFNEAEIQAKRTSDRMKKIYAQAFRNVNRDIASVYKNYSKTTGVDVQKLKTLLSKKETDKTWKTLKRQGLDKYIQNNYKSRISRLEQIQAQIYGKAKMIYPKEELAQRMLYKGVINDSYYKAIYDTQMGTGFDFGFNKLDNKTINNLLAENWQGSNYSKRIWNNTDILADSVSELVGGALLSGQSYEKTSRQIRDKFKVAKYYSDRLVRTETNYFQNQADAMAYEDMGIDKYVFVATLDSRTSEICQEMDNKVFNYKDMTVGDNYPPMHPNCRSTTRGYLGKEAEAMLQRRARNPETGKNETIPNMSYKEWANKNKIVYEFSTNNKNTKKTTSINNTKTRKEKEEELQEILIDINENRRLKWNLNLVKKEDIANSTFKDLTFSVDLKNIDDEMIDSIIDNYKKLGKDYCCNINHIGIFDDKDFLERPNSYGYTFVKPKTLTGEIHFNQKELNNFKEHIENIKNCSVVGYIPKTINPDNYKYYVSTHEFAHSIFNQEMLQKNLVGMDINIYKSFDKELDLMYNTYKNRMASLEQQIKDLNVKFVTQPESYTIEDKNLMKQLIEEKNKTFVSDYAVKKDLKDEFMAECFAEAKLADNPSETSINMLKLIDKYFKR